VAKLDKENRPDLSRRKWLKRSAFATASASAISFSGLMTLAGQMPKGDSGVPVWLANGQIRRVVTGINPQGKSFVVTDESVNINDVWDTSLEHPLGSADEQSRTVQPNGKTKLFFSVLQPSKDPKPNLTNRIGFRPTQGIAYCLLLSGEIQLLVDTQEVTLKAGDILVERMAAHSWRNDGIVPVAMLIVRLEV